VSSLGDVFDVDPADLERIDDLRLALTRTQKQLAKQKERTDLLVEATLTAAHDATLGLGAVPPVPAPKKDRRKRRGEVALWDTGDWQMSKITTTYNSAVCRERVMSFCDKAVLLTEIQRADHPVKEGVIVFGGDMVEGLFNFPCVDTETEALTPDGWKRLDDLDGQRVMIFDPADGSMRYETPAELFQAHYAGTMFHFVNGKIDHLVTPHHRMYVKSRKEHPYKVKRANEYGSGAHWYATSGAWAGGTWEPPAVHPAAYGSGWSWDGCDPLDLAEFIGWFVAEGHARPSEVHIAQSQFANPEKWERINLLLKRLTPYIPRLRAGGGVGYGATDRGFTISSTPLAAWMKQFKPDGSPSACLPSWVRNAPREVLAVLLDALMLGDGTYSPQGDGAGQYVTTSRRLADDVQEIAAKLGLSTHLGTRDRTDYSIRGAVGATLPQFIVTLSRQERTAKRTAEVEYDGTIWCPRVSTGLWLARRNGKIIVTGNTQPFEIDATLFEQFVATSRLMVDVVRRALATYETVKVVAEFGNHGRIGSKRDAVPRADNIDRMCFELARQLLAGEKRLTWEDNSDDVKRLEIGNYRALVIHGDEFGRGGFASPPTIVRHADRWASGAFRIDGQPWDFRDVYVHHYHTHQEHPMANGLGAVYFTGSTESDNRYARDGMSASATPSQRVNFIDPEKGRVTAVYKVWLD
jgi:hypothetical protein